MTTAEIKGFTIIAEFRTNLKLVCLMQVEFLFRHFSFLPANSLGFFELSHLFENTDQAVSHALIISLAIFVPAQPTIIAELNT